MADTGCAALRCLAALLAVLAARGAIAAGGQTGAVLYRDDFEKYPEGRVPEEMLVLSSVGSAAIQREGDNRVLQLPGSPLELHGVLIGPESPAIRGVSARAKAAATGRRTPEFGVGLGGTGGYQLWVMPATGELQIIKGEEVMAAVQWRWISGTWTHLRLCIRSAGAGKWLVEGKAWAEGDPEPKEWMVRWTETETPPTGRCMLAAAPYSDKAVLFDDVTIEGDAAGEQR